MGRKHDGQRRAAGCGFSPRKIVSRLMKYLRSRRSSVVPVVQASAGAGAGGRRRISCRQEAAAPPPTPVPLFVNGRLDYDNMTPTTRVLIQILARYRQCELERLAREEAEMTRLPDVVSVAGSFRGEDEEEEEEFFEEMDHFEVE